jgi:hypothetical protein
MNSSKAKEILLLYRGQTDDADPQFAEALAQARRDPILSDWVRQQGESYRAIRTKLCEIEPPPELREKIVRERPIPLARPAILPRLLKLAAVIAIFAGVAAFWLSLHREHAGVPSDQNGREVTVRGEVLDMACYIAYNLSGPEHAECAKDCIKKGLPVGIKSADGQVYLLVGSTTALNTQLADYAAKTITVKGKIRTRDGFAMLDDVTIQKL